MTIEQEKWNKEIDNYIELGKIVTMILLIVSGLIFSYYMQGKTITFSSDDSNIYIGVYLCLFLCMIKGFVDVVGNILGTAAWIVKQIIYVIKHKDELV